MFAVKKSFYSYLFIILFSMIIVFFTFRYLDHSYILSAGQQHHQTLRELIREESLTNYLEADQATGSTQNALVHVLNIYPDLLHVKITHQNVAEPQFEFGGEPDQVELIAERDFDREQLSLLYQQSSQRWFLSSRLKNGQLEDGLGIDILSDISAYVHASRPLQHQFIVVVVIAYIMLLANLVLLWKRFRQYQQQQNRVTEKYRDQWQQSSTMLEAAEEHILDAQSWRSRLLDNMSHELRTPLNAIIGYTEMVQEDLPPDDRVIFDDLNRVKYSARHLLSLIGDLLDVAKLESGEMRVTVAEFAVKELVDDLLLSIGDLAKKNHNQVTVELSESIGSVRTDLHKFRQALFNVLSNACKFTHNGLIQIKLQRLQVNDKEHIAVSVTDNGIGMSKAQMDKLMEEFPSADMEVVRKYGGIGIGLTITRYLTLLLGGEMRIKSEQGKGTTVTLNFPTDLMVMVNDVQAVTAEGRPVFEPEKLRFTPVAQSKDTPDRRKQISSILVIDDDPTVREAMRRQLNQSGFRVVGASTGAEGLELAHELRPDVITLDANLPGMDGWTVLKKLKNEQALAEIPVVMLTFAYNKDASSIRSVQGIVRKPVLWPDYIDLVKQCVRNTDNQ